MDLLKRVLRLVEETRLLFKAQSIAQGVVINASSGNFFGNFCLRSSLFDFQKEILGKIEHQIDFGFTKISFAALNKKYITKSTKFIKFFYNLHEILCNMLKFSVLFMLKIVLKHFQNC